MPNVRSRFDPILRHSPDPSCKSPITHLANSCHANIRETRTWTDGRRWSCGSFCGVFTTHCATDAASIRILGNRNRCSDLVLVSQSLHELSIESFLLARLSIHPDMAKCTASFLMNADVLSLLIEGLTGLVKNFSKMVFYTHRILNDDILMTNEVVQDYPDDLSLSIRTRRPSYFIYVLRSLQDITFQPGCLSVSDVPSP